METANGTSCFVAVDLLLDDQLVRPNARDDEFQAE